jgi:hypothetical protein
MARKVETYVVADEGRDKGKSFLLTEWPASKAESWAIRALLALGAANVELPEGALGGGMASLTEIGLKKLFALPFSAAGPLLDELMTCVEVVPDAKRPHVKRAVIEEDVEEVRTRLSLKWEVLKLHLDFSIADALSGSNPRTAAETQQPRAQTSHRRSA